MPKQSEILNQKFIERAGLPFASVLDEAEIQRHQNLTHRVSRLDLLPQYRDLELADASPSV
jgi:hypothetical protein